jgi:hypothetical protein
MKPDTIVGVMRSYEKAILGVRFEISARMEGE